MYINILSLLYFITYLCIYVKYVLFLVLYHYTFLTFLNGLSRHINNKSSNSISETLDLHYMSIIRAVTIIITTPPAPPPPPRNFYTLYYIFFLSFQLSLHGSHLKSTQP